MPRGSLTLATLSLTLLLLLSVSSPSAATPIKPSSKSAKKDSKPTTSPKPGKQLSGNKNNAGVNSSNKKKQKQLSKKDTNKNKTKNDALNKRIRNMNKIKAKANANGRQLKNKSSSKKDDKQLKKSSSGDQKLSKKKKSEKKDSKIGFNRKQEKNQNKKQYRKEDKTVRNKQMKKDDKKQFKMNRKNSNKKGGRNDLKAKSSRVINGMPVTDKREFPFVVDISNSDVDISSTRFCTGTLIDSTVVLTAAHCVLNDGYRSAVYATVGRIELEDGHSDNKHVSTFRTVGSMVHPEYTGIGSPKDVAILLLNDSSDAPLVTLSRSTPTVGVKTWVVGYGIQKIGTLEETGQPIEILSGRLQKTELRIEKRSKCDMPDAKFRTPEGLLCTAGVKIGSSACRGDSGGGLFVRKSKVVSQVGIVSYGDAQCAAEEAGVFTDVAHVHKWVDGAVKKLKKALKPVHLFMEDEDTELVHSSRIGTHVHDYRLQEIESHKNHSQAAHGEGVKFYKVHTNFSSLRHVKVSLCDGPNGYRARLSVKNETDNTVVYDDGSCPGGKLSQIMVRAKRDAFVIGVTGNRSVHYQLSLSSKVAAKSGVKA